MEQPLSYSINLIRNNVNDLNLNKLDFTFTSALIFVMPHIFKNPQAGKKSGK